MRFFTLAALFGAALAQKRGFNYGATNNDGSVRAQQDFENEFNRAKNLQGQSGFNSARLYTMIQGGTPNTVTSAIPAAINTKTTLLLGLWGSAGQDAFNQELTALKNAINQYGTAFTDLIDGISIGSEDLYRITPTGIENNSGRGEGPAGLVNYINQVRDLIRGTPASGAKLGHVDTWTAWVNGSNSAVINAVDWLGMDGYPYYQTTQANGIENGAELFFASYDATVNVANGKPVWVTETGWPVQGPNAGQAVASTQNAETYWQAVACKLLGSTNLWWFTLNDPPANSGAVSFSVVGPSLNDAPLYNLACSGGNSNAQSVASSSTAKPSTTAAAPTQPSVSSGAEPFSIETAPNSMSGPSIPATGNAGSQGSQTMAPASGSAPAGSAPAGSMTAAAAPGPSMETGADGQETHYVYQTTMITVSACNTEYVSNCPAACDSTPAPAPAPSSSKAMSSSQAPAPSSSKPAMSSAPKSSAPASSMAKSSSKPAASAPPSSSSAAKSCPTNLSGEYQYPHLMVPVSSKTPNTPAGTSYNGTITPDSSAILNFDFPASYAGKTCSFVFLFPQKSDLETSSYSFNNKGGLKVSVLSGPADASTTYANAPKASGPSGSIPSLMPGNGYTVITGMCPAGQRVGYEISSTGGAELNYFQDYNPSPLGGYVTVC